MLPPEDALRVREWVNDRNAVLPEEAIGQVRYELDVESRSITIVETRPPWTPGMGPEWTRHTVARARYVQSRGVWGLYWRDRNGHFHRYDRTRDP
jgi:hypothetical protein